MHYSYATLAAQAGLIGAGLAVPFNLPVAPPLSPFQPLFEPPFTLPNRFPPLPGPANPPPQDDSVQAALAAMGRSFLPFREPGTVPFPLLPPGTDTMPKIKNIVYLMMENHSYDNMMGMLTRPDADGFELDKNGVPIGTQPGVNGTTQHWFETATPCQNEDMVSQEWTTCHNAYNNGSMNGAVVNPITHTTKGASGSFAMSYFTKEVLPSWFALLEQVPIADRWFCSTLAQTWPNRQLSLAGTSRGVTATGQNLTGITWPAGTIFNLLDKYGISWKVAWNATENTTGNTLEEFNGVITTESQAEHIVDYATFFADAASGSMPSFYYLDQRGAATTMEPAKNMALGENLIYEVVKAVMTGPNWDETLFILNFDEHGGFADHVTPPPALAGDNVLPITMPGEFQYEAYQRMGFRVPAFVLSPYGKPNFVSHTVYRHESVLAFMERKWNLEAMTFTDANANSIEDMVDLVAMALGTKHFPSFDALKLPLPLLQVPGNDALNCANTPLTPPPESVTRP